MNSKLIIITGFCGAGKDTIVNRLLDKKPYISRLITHTSRPIRPEEHCGTDYHFVSNSSFLLMKKKELFLEHKKYGKHWKGTSKEEFQKVFNNQHLLWRIDMSMAAMVEERFIEAFEENTANQLLKHLIKVLIKAPSPDEALKRFILREGSNADIKEFQKRLKQDEEIWNKFHHRFPHIIINHNGKQEETLQKVLKIIGI